MQIFFGYLLRSYKILFFLLLGAFRFRRPEERRRRKRELDIGRFFQYNCNCFEQCLYSQLVKGQKMKKKIKVQKSGKTKRDTKR